MGSVYIRTCTGDRFYLDSPSAYMVDIEQGIHALSLICRFTGHTRFHFSVLRHSIWVARCLRDWGAPLKVIRAGLLHDFSEAYYNDLSSPMKSLLGEDWLMLKGRVDAAVDAAYDIHLTKEEHALLKAADYWAGDREGDSLVRGFSGITHPSNAPPKPGKLPPSPRFWLPAWIVRLQFRWWWRQYGKHSH